MDINKKPPGLMIYNYDTIRNVFASWDIFSLDHAAIGIAFEELVKNPWADAEESNEIVKEIRSFAPAVNVEQAITLYLMLKDSVDRGLGQYRKKQRDGKEAADRRYGNGVQ